MTNMTNVKKLSEIEAKPVLRNQTGFVDLDLLYGKNELLESEYNIGMPKGKISLWAGESGVGKSRLCIELAKKFSTYYWQNGIVLYFQTESPLSDFASWAKDTKQYPNIWCSGESKIDEMIKIIYELKPKLIFIDSVNEIDEFENGNKKEARRLIKGADGKPGLKQATHDVGAHLILLGQLNQDGKTIKGGTSLPHLVDIALNVVKTKVKGIFRVEVGTKHRYGSTDGYADFRHTDDGVVEDFTELGLLPNYDPRKTKPPVMAPKLVKNNTPVQTRVGALNSKGYVVLTNGEPNKNDPDYKEHMVNVAKKHGFKLDSNGNAIPKSEQGILNKLNKSVGRMFGLK